MLKSRDSASPVEALSLTRSAMRLPRNSCGSVRFDRSDLKNAEWKPGRIGTSDLNLELNDGTRFEMQAARVNRGKAERVHLLLSASESSQGGAD